MSTTTVSALPASTAKPFTTIPGSNVLTVGFFSVARGTRISVPRPRPQTSIVPTNSTAATYFMTYQTTFQCSLGDFIPAEAHVYSPPNDLPLPDNTVVFLIGRVCTSVSGAALIDVIHLFPCPGDPADPSYDTHIPDAPYPFLVVLGVVLGAGEELGDGSRCFNVEASAHVCDQKRSSFIRCVFESTSARWRNMRTPSPLTMVHVLGMCRHVAPGGHLAISISDITLNAAPAPVQFHTNPDSPGPSTPTKRRRFNAFVPSSPASVTASPSRTSDVGTSGSVGDDTLPSAPPPSASTSSTLSTIGEDHGSDLSDLYASDHGADNTAEDTNATQHEPEAPRTRASKAKGSSAKGKERAHD